MNLPEDQGYHEAMWQYADEKPQRVITENINSIEATRIGDHLFQLSKPMTCKHCKRLFQTATETGTLTVKPLGLFAKTTKYPVVRLNKCPDFPNH